MNCCERFSLTLDVAAWRIVCAGCGAVHEDVRALRAERDALRALLVRVRNRLAVTAEAIDEATA